MEPDLLADEPLLTGKKAHEAREARSPRNQFTVVFAVAFVGFAVTSVALWFGPRAVQYVREFAGPFSGVAPKSRDAPKSNPWAIPDFKPVWDSEKSLVIRPPSTPQFNIPQGNGFSAPRRGRGVNSSGFGIHR
jgi:hypothetical protein